MLAPPLMETRQQKALRIGKPPSMPCWNMRQLRISAAARGIKLMDGAVHSEDVELYASHDVQRTTRA
jgi:hypothetical protein